MIEYKFPKMPPLENGDWLTVFWEDMKWEVRNKKGKLKAKGKMIKLKPILRRTKRIQMKRTKGWRKPKNTVYVGRPTIWGNPYKVGDDGDLTTVLEKYKHRLDYLISAWPTFLDDLVGKDLACWCPLDRECHADILLAKIKEIEMHEKD